MKAIETVYKGYRFRSRLEARWAVLFDALGAKWEYELEGFELNDGMRYLPDFYFPEQKCFVEIKPEFPDQKEIQKYCMLSAESWKWVDLIVGLPTKHDVFGYRNGEESRYGPLVFGRCNGCGSIGFASYSFELGYSRGHCYKCDWSTFDLEPDEFRAAATKALSARFEHGERGYPYASLQP